MKNGSLLVISQLYNIIALVCKFMRTSTAL